MNDDGHSSHVPIHLEQLRVGHICAILVRNLSLRPTRDRAFQTLTSKRIGGDIHTTSDDTDLTLSLAKPNNKGKIKAGVATGRSRSASWSRISGSNSDEDVVSTPTRSRFRDNHDSHAPLIRQNSTGATTRLPYSHPRWSVDPNLSHELSPRPILKRASTTRDGDTEPRYSDFLSGYSPGGPSSSSLSGGYETPMLSRSDSRSSSRSSHTIRRPEHRTRTTSTTSTRSVRFDKTISRSPSESRRSPRLVGRLSDASRLLLFSDKSPSQIMKERLLECYVELALPLDASKSMASDPFYKTPMSKPGLHHSWGMQGGTPIAPERDFVKNHDQSPLDSSCLWMRLWARQIETKEDSAWKVVWERSVDLRELTPVPGYAQNPSISLPHNSVLLGLAPGANSLSGRDSLGRLDLVKTNAVKGQKTSPLRDVHPDESDRIRRVLDNIVYYAVPLTGKGGDSDDVKAFPTNSLRTIGKTPARRGSEGEGYASDPEIAPSELRIPTGAPSTRPTDRHKAFLDEQRRVTELSLRETKMMPSYTLAEARAIVQRQTQLGLLFAEVQDRKVIEEDLLCDSAGRIQLGLQRNQLQATLQEVQASYDGELADLQAKQSDLNDRKAKVSARRLALSSSKAILKAQTEAQADVESRISNLRSQQAELLVVMHSVHAKILHDLEIIFPIELLDASSLLFCICGLPLPNAASSISSSELDKEEKQWKEAIKQMPPSSRPLFQAFDDDTISSALGLVAQLVILLSTYLSTPVHYPMATAGSRAVIQDCISLMSGPRAFPLYSKGIERYRYDYAAFLLNKNIEQLMNVHSVTVIDIRHTLPNLKNLMVTVAAASPTSHLTRKSHIGKSEISLESNSDAALSRKNGVASVDLDSDAGITAKVKTLSGLGLGLPTSARTSSSATDSKNVASGKSLASNGKGRAQPTDTLVTTRVLGSSKPAAQGGGAIESVSRALSYFGGSRRG